MLNIAHTIPRSAVNGPGERFVIWLQGCSLRCRGCWNPDTWSTRPTILVTAGELAATVLSTPGIEGITLTGGEPFQQAKQLIPLVERVRAAELSVMAFTGYELGELTDDAQETMLGLCDIVVAGRYRESERSLGLRWRGSANQTVHFLTTRYSPFSTPESTECEIHIAHDGSVTVTGFPPESLSGRRHDGVEGRAAVEGQHQRR